MLQGQICQVWIYFPIDEQSDFWCFPIFSPILLHRHIMVVSPVYCEDGCYWIFFSGFRFAKRSWMTQETSFEKALWKREKNTDLLVIWKWNCCKVIPCCLRYICSINLGDWGSSGRGRVDWLIAPNKEGERSVSYLSRECCTSDLDLESRLIYHLYTTVIAYLVYVVLWCDERFFKSFHSRESFVCVNLDLCANLCNV